MKQVISEEIFKRAYPDAVLLQEKQHGTGEKRRKYRLYVLIDRKKKKDALSCPGYAVGLSTGDYDSISGKVVGSEHSSIEIQLDRNKLRDVLDRFEHVSKEGDNLSA